MRSSAERGNASDSEWPRLGHQLRQLTRTLHMSGRTEEAQGHWLEEFIRFHRHRPGKWRHTLEMGSDEVNQFLTSLAVDRKVSASTQN